MSFSSLASSPPAAVAPRLRELTLDRLAAHAGRSRTLVLAVPAPRVAPESLLRLSPRDFAVLWDPPTGQAVAGVGAAHRIQLRGKRRFATLRQRSGEIGERLVCESLLGAALPAPRFLGGLAFDVGAATAEPWAEFGDGCFTLPRITYCRTADAATLSLAVRCDLELGCDRAASWAEELLQLLAGLESWALAAPSLSAQPLAVERVEKSAIERWSRQVQRVHRAVAAGEVEKIVAARRSLVELAGAADPVAFLERLGRGLLASTRFAFRRPQSTFLGATPERLISRHGAEIVTEALAGSIASDGERAAELLSSRKDLREHQLVVDEVVRRLAPLTSHLEVAEEPLIRELREVLHLCTPIRGHLAEPRHVLELVEALHPTPAVGGVPSERARRWIADNEDHPRGWYAGPIGWFDGSGDGEFAVALRGCLLAGRRAFVYVGAGIVRGSEAELEYHETELKKRTLLAALGAGE